ncbi:serine/threonine-protein kinase S6KL-like [Anthonomus grandis grandis]|uniref:serine/threonine-protein kinase S6KL-like n=1 Tax=Anthonomus grandis grandis TaxID=2921223 RepID=UPI0021663C9E|nr:serine/threonine-protein kinase S6KL-like [Anthonomus grandis grandis]
MGQTIQIILYAGSGKFLVSAPEVLLRVEPYGHAADWWSLGATACLMLSAKLPEIQMLSDIPEERSTVRVQMPEISVGMAARDLLLRLLEVEPKNRIKSVRALGNIAFYKGYKFENVKGERVKAKDLLVKYFGENYMKRRDDSHDFDGFDEVFIGEEEGLVD